MILKHVWAFSAKPVYRPYVGIPPALRLKTVASAIVWNLILSIVIVIIAEVLFTALEIDVGKHKTAEMFAKYSSLEIFVLMVLFAPLLEECLFRAPLYLFKRSSFFPFAFYLSCIAFGMVHLSNFENGSDLLLWAPFLVAPQTVMGFFLGFLRVKLGLSYAILMHAGHNGLLFLLTLFIEIP